MELGFWAWVSQRFSHKPSQDQVSSHMHSFFLCEMHTIRFFGCDNVDELGSAYCRPTHLPFLAFHGWLYPSARILWLQATGSCLRSALSKQESMEPCGVSLRTKGRIGGQGSGRTRLGSALRFRKQKPLGNIFRVYILGRWTNHTCSLCHSSQDKISQVTNLSLSLMSTLWPEHLNCLIHHGRNRVDMWFLK